MQHGANVCMHVKSEAAQDLARVTIYECSTLLYWGTCIDVFP